LISLLSSSLLLLLLLLLLLPVVHNLPNEDAEHEEITRKRKLSRGEEPARLLQETDFVNPSIFLFSNVFSFFFVPF